MAEQKAIALINGKLSEIPLGDTVRGAGGGYQKYYIAPSETYIIPVGVSSVVSGPLENEGIVVIEGRLEIL